MRGSPRKGKVHDQRSNVCCCRQSVLLVVGTAFCCLVVLMQIGFIGAIVLTRTPIRTDGPIRDINNVAGPATAIAATVSTSPQSLTLPTPSSVLPIIDETPEQGNVVPTSSSVSNGGSTDLWGQDEGASPKTTPMAIAIAKPPKVSQAAEATLPLSNRPQVAWAPSAGVMPDLSILAPFDTGRALRANEVDTSSMTSFVASGGRLPVALVTCCRPSMLRESLASLLSCRGITRDDIIVVQDASNPDVQKSVLAEVSQVAHDFGVGLIKSEAGRLRGVHSDGAQRIAKHYGFALGESLKRTQAPGVIVAEDDFLFSPDFYEYFHAAAVAIEADSSLWLASAWNDNGLRHNVADPWRVWRTRFFPGLGWLLPRSLWEDELQRQWPNTHWDHWMRDKRRHNGRDVLFPEIPRDYHIGVKGTFMDREHHDKYFRTTAMHAPSRPLAGSSGFSWMSAEGTAAMQRVVQPKFREDIMQLLRDSVSVGKLSSLLELGESAKTKGLEQPVIARIRYTGTGAADNADYRKVLNGFFDAWHEPQRGSRAGMHVLRLRTEGPDTAGTEGHHVRLGSPAVQVLLLHEGEWERMFQGEEWSAAVQELKQADDKAGVRPLSPGDFAAQRRVTNGKVGMRSADMWREGGRTLGKGAGPFSGKEVVRRGDESKLVMPTVMSPLDAAEGEKAVLASERLFGRGAGQSALPFWWAPAPQADGSYGASSFAAAPPGAWKGVSDAPR